MNAKIPPIHSVSFAHCPWQARVRPLIASLLLALGANLSQGQLFENLKSLAPRLPVGDPAVADLERGPKGIAAADFNGDGLADFAVSDKNGSVTLYLSRGADGFAPPAYLSTGTNELRAIVAADLNGDSRPDLLTVSPFDGLVTVFLNQPNGSWVANPFFAWVGARDLITADFNNDQKPDLAVAGPNLGLRQYLGLGDGTFAALTSFEELDAGKCGDGDDFPQPAYFLQTFRPPGQTRDSLAVAHGEECERMWVLRPDATGVLRIIDTILGIDINALAIGPVLHNRASGIPDLVTASVENGYIEVRPYNPVTGSFQTNAVATIEVPGGPRSMKLVDWDEDGWNDLAVVLRHFEKVTLFNNQTGQLKAGPTIAVGRLPRELDAADFTGDGHVDLAVVNRYSLDVTVVPGFLNSSTFTALDQIYPVEGTVSGLIVKDYNRDGRDDVVQGHIASAELSVRLSGPNGLLGPATYYPLGTRPSAQSVTDVNNDGKPDVVSVDLQGSISVRLGLGDGTFGPEEVFTLPDNLRGGLFALVAADFNNDGKVDLAAGFMDCRLVFLKGNGDGTFSIVADYDHPLTFTYEARSMAAADFDQDGDLDLVGAGYDGKVSVVENRGNLLSTKFLHITSYESPNLQDIRSIQVLDENGDGDWDLFVAGPTGSAIFLGEPGLGFKLSHRENYDQAAGAGTSSALGDFDGDGQQDLVVANADSNTLSVFVRKGVDAPWETALLVSVPSAMFIASGDLDGDGKPDLVGTGDVLWTALSSHRSRPVAQTTDSESHSILPKIVINEFLASNESLPVAADGNRFSDWIEIYNGGALDQVLKDWKVQVIKTNKAGVASTNRYTFPGAAKLSGRQRLLLVATEKVRTPYHTGFVLPLEGACLELLNPQGALVDRIEYPAQDTDRSFSRFRDGAVGWVVNPYPSPNRPNLDNGTLDPKVTFQGVDPETVRPGKPIRFKAQGRDDLGITVMSLLWSRLDIPDAQEHRVILFDDGMHDDGQTQDGHFVGQLEPGLPIGAKIQFYLEVQDLTAKSIFVPGKPERSLATPDPNLFTLAVGMPTPTLEISEIVASNRTGLTDENGGHPDWVEIRNYGATAVRLDKISLSLGLFEDANRYKFPNDAVLAPGSYFIVFCDNNVSQSARHAPFDLGADGGQLFLIETLSGGARSLIDGVTYPALNEDQAWGRNSLSGTWSLQQPTPAADSWAGLWIGFVRGQAQLALQTRADVRYTIETTPSMDLPRWTTFRTLTGDGKQFLQTLSGGATGYFRLRTETP